MPNKTFVFTGSVPPGAEDIPGIWQNKSGRGFRVPLNAHSVIGWGSPVAGVCGDGTIAAALSGELLRGDLRGFAKDHQKRLLRKALAVPGGHVWAPPGAGKTLVGLVYACAVAGTGPKLIVTKAAARGTWAEQCERYTTLKPKLLLGQTPPRGGIELREDTLYITAWETIKYWREALVAFRPEVIVWDEIHWLRRPKHTKATVLEDGSIRYEGLGNSLDSARQIAEVAARKLGLTATPIPGRVRDLWTQLDLVEPWQWGSFFQFGMRYCLEPKAPVLMADGTYRAIADIQVGDEVMGWGRDHGKKNRAVHPTKVLETFRVEGPRVRVHLESGKTVVCSPDHQWWVNYHPHSKRPYMPLFTEMHRQKWRRPIKHIIPLGYDAARLPEPEEGEQYMRGYLRGLVDGDGHVRASESSRGLRRSVTAHAKELPHLERAHGYAQALSWAPRPIVQQKDGIYRLGFYTKAAYEDIVLPRESEKEFCRGWLAGIYDAEGSQNVIAQHRRVNPKIWQFIQTALEVWGFTYTASEKAIYIRGGTWERLRFFGTVRPALIRKIDSSPRRAHIGAPGYDKIVRIEPMGPGELACIKTETGNFITDGLGSHNCAGQHNGYGYEYNGLSNAHELRDRLGFVKCRVKREEVNKHLPKKRREVVRLSLAEQNKPSAMKRDLARAAKAASGGDESARESYFETLLMEAASRKHKYVEDRVITALKSGQKVVVFTGRRIDCERLAARLNKAVTASAIDAEMWWAHGGTDPSDRDTIRNEYMAREGAALLVGTGDAWGESVDLQDTDLALISMLPWTPDKVIQWEGRFSRLGQKRPVLVSYVIARQTADEHVADLLLDKLPHVGEIAEDAAANEIEGALGGVDESEGASLRLLERIAQISLPGNG